MAGRFEGMTDDQWAVVAVCLPPEPAQRGPGMPHADFRGIINAIAYVEITGCRWCDVPVGPQWGKRSTSHRWLGRWTTDGTWERLKRYLLGAAELAKAIDWDNASVDGSFSPREGRRPGRRARLQGKGRDVA